MTIVVWIFPVITLVIPVLYALAETSRGQQGGLLVSAPRAFYSLIVAQRGANCLAPLLSAIT